MLAVLGVDGFDHRRAADPALDGAACEVAHRGLVGRGGIGRGGQRGAGQAAENELPGTGRKFHRSYPLLSLDTGMVNAYCEDF